MSHITIDVDDNLAEALQEYVQAQGLSIEKLTHQLWQETLSQKAILNQKATPSQKVATIKPSIPNLNFAELLNNTQGIWQHGDGLEYQNQLREEWEGRP